MASSAIATASRLLIGALLVVCGCKAEEREACEDSDGCEEGLTCLREQCVSAEFKNQEEACRADPQCKEEGLCGAKYVVRDRAWQIDCRAVADADCAASDDCKNQGGCQLQSDFCGPATGADCAKSAACPKDGLCARHLNEGAELAKCRATKPEHCQQSYKCKAFEHCAVGSEGECDSGEYHPDCETSAANVTAKGFEKTDEWRGVFVDAPAFEGTKRLERATVTCTLMPGNYPKWRDTWISVGDTCRVMHRGPKLSVTDVTVNEGDVIAVHAKVQGRFTHSVLGYIALPFEGKSPLRGSDGELSVVCHVVPRDMAEREGKRALEQAFERRDALAAKRRSRPRRSGNILNDLGVTMDELLRPSSQTKPRDGYLGDVRRGGDWLGWQHADVEAALEELAR
jgi:hypothetical protein